MHLMAEKFLFFRAISGFSEKGSQNLSNETNVAFLLFDLYPVFTSIVYEQNRPKTEESLP